MKNTFQRLIALILVFSMTMSLLSSTAWAAELAEEMADSAEASTVEVEDEPTEAEEAEEQPDESEVADEPEAQPDESAQATDIADESAAQSDESELAEESEGENVVQPEATRILYSGTCGKNLTWTLDNAGLLTISGSGAMKDYGWNNSTPWRSYRSSIKKIVIQKNVTSIGASTFEFCRSLTSITIPNSVTSIGNDAFFGCEGLTNITIPNSVTSIGNGAFEGCSSLTSITIPNSVTSIGDEAFRSCSSLTSITIPKNVTSIGNDAFSGCSSLTSITVDSGNSIYSSKGGVLYNKKQTILICYPGDKSGGFVIPNSVTNINNSAFLGCSGLTSITIPNSVTSIGNYAFGECDSLISVTIPTSVTSIGDSAFGYCSYLTSIYFCGNAPSISGEHCFYYVTATAYYPVNNSTWTSSKRKNYGGSITWKTWTPTTVMFNADTYRADYYLKNQSNSTENVYFSSTATPPCTPCTTLYNIGKDEGLATSVKAWKAVTNALSAADKPSSVVDATFEKKDMYEAIIFNIFKVDSESNSTLLSKLTEIQDNSSELLKYVKAGMKLKFNIDITQNYNLSQLTSVQKESLFSMANEWFTENHPILKKLGTGLDISQIALNYATAFSDWCKYAESCAALMDLSLSEKQVLSSMYDNATNSDLKAALKECVSVMDSSQDEYIKAMMKKFSTSMTTTTIKTALDKGWDVVKDAVKASNPYAFLLWFSYEASTIFCNTLFSTDKVSEQFCKIEAIVETETLLRKVYNLSKKAYKNSKTAESATENAAILNSVVTVIYSCIDLDCQYAYDFSYTADNILWVKFLQAFGAKDHAGLLKSIQDIRVNTEMFYYGICDDWINSIQDSYPLAYAVYKNQLIYTIKAVTVSSVASSYTYTGKAIKPSLSLNYGGDTKLTNGTDYTVKFSDNTKVGTATITITGKGHYTGTTTVTFKINPTKTTLSSVSNTKKKAMTVKWKKNLTGDGYEIQYSTKSNFSSGTKTATVKKNATTSKKITGLTKNKTYYVRIRTYKTVSKKKYYSGWSSVKKVKISK